MTNPSAVAERLQPYAQAYGKPLLASWMGGVSIALGEKVLNTAGIPTFPYPDTAARAFTYMWRYSHNLHELYETPALVDSVEPEGVARSRAEQVIDKARNRGRVLLTELESKQILSYYGIPTVETRAAENDDEAVKQASEIGYPVVLKVFSETITHKSDVGGVKLNLHDEQSVRSAFREIESSVTDSAGRDQFLGVTVQPMVGIEGCELILGSSVDAQFGPVIVFGSGGRFVEVYRDHAVALPPLNSTLAQILMEQTHIFKALKGVRGRLPVDLVALANLMVRFSQLVVELPWIAEIDLNPLLASSEGLLALDARVLLHDPSLRPEQLPKPAIRPYPSQYVSQFTMNDGAEVTLRPIRPEDEPLMRKFHETLSERSIYMRYFSSQSLSSRVAHERLVRVCFVDYDRVMALVVDRKDKVTGQHQILGVGRLIKLHTKNEFQKQGLGIELLRRTVQIARDEKLSSVSAEMLRDNFAVQSIFKELGFRLQLLADSSSVSAVLDLRIL
jgi:acetyltransferase